MAAPEDTLTKVLDSIIKKQFPRGIKVGIKPLTTGGRNYTSALFTATIKTEKENVELFAKVGTMAADLGIRDIYQSEDRVYTKIASAYEQLQDKHGISEDRFVFPKYNGYFEVDGVQCAVMENLVAKEYDVLDRLKCIDWDYASKAVEVLAKFHALSFAFKKELPGEFSEHSKALKQPPWTDGEQWQGLIDQALEAVDEEDKEKVSRCLEGNVGWCRMHDFYKPIKTAVLIHNDYRPSNLMHKKLDGQYDIIPVDYQTVHLGCPVSDLVYFIIMGSDHQFRQQHYKQLVEHYYQQLSSTLKALGIEVHDVYPKDEFNSDLKEKLSYGIYIGAMAIPFVTVAPEKAPNFALGQFVPPPHQLFAERFRGLVQDYKQWGII